MKQLITQGNDKFVFPEELKGREYIAYATKKEKPDQKSTYCILSRLENGKFGFINPFYTGTAPSFVDVSPSACCIKAAKKRKVCVFNTAEEMLTALLNKTF